MLLGCNIYAFTKWIIYSQKSTAKNLSPTIQKNMPDNQIPTTYNPKPTTNNPRPTPPKPTTNNPKPLTNHHHPTIKRRNNFAV